MTATSGPAADYSRKWYVMAAVAMGIFLATIDGSIVNVALPTLVGQLGASFATVQWVVLSYLLTLVTLLLAVGRLADIGGKKRIYRLGFLVFTVGSLLCGLAFTVHWLIVMRILQAVGAAMILALGPAIVTESFPASERGRALGTAGAVVSIGIITGPTLGGLILDAFSWHWIFFVNVPIGLFGVWMVTRFVPDLPPIGGKRFDYWGAGTLFVGLLTLLLGLTLGQTFGFTSPLILTLFALFVLFFGLFIAIELRVAEPMLDLSLFRNSLFSANLLTGFVTFVAISGTLLLIPFYLQNIRGFDVRQVGLLLAVTPIATGIMAPLSGSLSDRVGSRRVALAGLAILLLGYLGLTTLTATTPIVNYLLFMFVVGLGMGIFLSPNNSAIMGAVPRGRLGVASGLLSVTRTLGQTVGIAVLGALWAARVVAYNGGPVAGGASAAATEVQVSALQDTYRVVAGLLLLGVLLGAWSFLRERRERRK